MAPRSIAYTTLAGPLGELLIAATERGVCFVGFGRNRQELHARLEAEFPFAPLVLDEIRLRRFAGAIQSYLTGETRSLELPLDVRGSRFQRRVWDALRRIPRGQTRSYSDVARSIGRPNAARAVARACATNPVSLLIPCHRVVAKDGSPGGYAWGVGRKLALLRTESDFSGRCPEADPSTSQRPLRVPSPG